MSKVYALSGLRAAYLAGSGALIESLRRITPPWAVSLPAQVAAVAALQDLGYYASCYAETHALRTALSRRLADELGFEVIPGVANFLLCHLREDGPTAAATIAECRKGWANRSSDDCRMPQRGIVSAGCGADGRAPWQTRAQNSRQKSANE